MEKKSKKLSRHRPFVRPFRGIWARIEGGEQGFYRPRASNLWNRFPAWRSRASVTPFLCDKRLYAKKVVVVPGYIFLATVSFFGKARKFRFSWEFEPGMKILKRRGKTYTIHWNNVVIVGFRACYWSLLKIILWKYCECLIEQQSYTYHTL